VNNKICCIAVRIRLISTKYIIILSFFLSMFVWPQGVRTYYGDLSPFKLKEKPSLHFSNGVLPDGVFGTVAVRVYVDSKCQLVHFTIININLSDSTAENVVKYTDDDAFNRHSLRESKKSAYHFIRLI
jgi:hypothetical protein